VIVWTIAPGESAELAKAFIADAIVAQGIDRDQLTIHADRGSSMTSKPVAQLLVDLGVTRTYLRPHVSNDNPYSEANFKTLKVLPGVPGTVRIHPRRPRVLHQLLRLQPRPPPFRHRPPHRRIGALRHRDRDPDAAPADPRCGLRRQPRPVLRPDPDRIEAAHRGLDQPAQTPEALIQSA